MKTTPLRCLILTTAAVALGLLPRLNANPTTETDPFTVPSPNTLSFINNPNANYAQTGSYFIDTTTAYAVNLAPPSAITVSMTGHVPIISIGDGTTIMGLTIGSNVTLEAPGSFAIATNIPSLLNFSGSINGTNDGTIALENGTNTAFISSGVLTVSADLHLINTGSILSNQGNSSAGGYAINAGTISFLNNNGGTIAGGILSNGDITNLTNSGSIATVFERDAIQTNGNLVTLTNTGTISGSTNGVGIFVSNGTIGTITNSGHISGGNDGIENFANIGTITNQAAGVISGNTAIQTNGTISDIENSGQINGNTGNGVGIFTGGSITTLNNFASSRIQGEVGINAQGGFTTLNNQGVILGANGPAIEAIGNITSLANSGSGIIQGSTGISTSNAITTLTNSNSAIIQGSAGDGIDADRINSLTTSGTSIITGTTDGVHTNDYANITLNGGNISGSKDAIEVNVTNALGAINASTTKDTSTITINGAAGVGKMVEDNGTGVITLNLIGLNSTSKAQFAALVGHTSGDVTDNLGQTYNWSGFTLEGNFGSPSSGQTNLLPVDLGLQPLANTINANGLPSGTPWTTFAADAGVNPEAAVQSLSGRVIDIGLQDIKVNINNQISTQFESELQNLGQNTSGGFAASTFSVGDSQTLAFINTSEQLNGLVSQATLAGVSSLSTDSSALGAKPSDKRWSLWLDGTVTLANESARGAQAGYHGVYDTPTIGASYRLSNAFTVGLLSNVTTAGANFGDGSQINLTSELAGPFVAYHQGPWQANAFAVGGVTQYHDQRATLDGTTASSSPSGTDVLTGAAGSYEFNLGHGTKIWPQVGLQYSHIEKDAVGETGSDLGLNVARQDFDTLRSHLGFAVAQELKVDDHFVVTPDAHAAWYHEFLDNNNAVETNLEQAPQLGSFAINSNLGVERDYALIGVGMKSTFNGYGTPIGTFVNYDVQAGQSSYLAHSISGGIRLEF